MDIKTNNKSDLMKIQKVKDFILVVEKMGYTEKKKNGSSHRIFSKQNNPTLSIPDHNSILSRGSKRNIVKLILQEKYYNK